MAMRSLMIPAAGWLLLTSLTACDGDGVRISSTRTETGNGGPLKVVETLQCPQTIGDLTRKGSAVEGGTRCDYVGPRGAEVTLHLARLGGADTPDTVLKRYEDQMSALLPDAVAQLRTARPDTAAVAVQTSGDTANVDMPGLKIEAEGEKANIQIGGIRINADDKAANVDIQGREGESVSVQAQDDAAEVRVRNDGEATRAHWILSDNRPSTDGWRKVGYEARGPVGGPLVVATIRSRDRNNDRVFDDAKDLVALNVGE